MGNNIRQFVSLARTNLVRLPRFLAERAFFFTLFLIALAVLIALLVLFLSYGTLKKDAAKQTSTGIEFKEETFIEMFKNWEQREADFAGPKTPNIPDIF